MTVCGRGDRGEEEQQEEEVQGASRGSFFSPPAQQVGRVHMDLVDLYLPECFTYCCDTE